MKSNLYVKDIHTKRNDAVIYPYMLLYHAHTPTNLPAMTSSRKTHTKKVLRNFFPVDKVINVHAHILRILGCAQKGYKDYFFRLDVFV